MLLGRLVELGVVERADVPPAAHLRLERDHVAAKPHRTHVSERVA
jgi:hypothetical protein